MKLFDSIIHEVTEYKNRKRQSGLFKETVAEDNCLWPESEHQNLVLLPDLGVELGNPDKASVSFLTWTEDTSTVDDGKITLIGPDIGDPSAVSLPFGKVVIVGVEGMNEENAYERNREMFLAKFDISLKGFMLKSASHYMAEWCRISNEAVENGFSFATLGNALVREYKTLDYVKTVEIVFITSSDDDVNELYDMGNRTARIISAMSKMVNEMIFDCGACEYQDVCDDADGLRAMRDNLKSKN